MSNNNSEATQMAMNPEAFRNQENTASEATAAAAAYQVPPIPGSAARPMPSSRPKAANGNNNKGKQVATHAAAAVGAAGLGVAAAAAVNHFTADAEDQFGDEAEQVAANTTGSNASSAANTAPAAGATEPAAGAAEPGSEVVDPIEGSAAPSDEVVDPNSVAIDPGDEIDAVVDPEDVAVAIIAGDEVDPMDIDTANVLDFHAITEVYDEDGGVYTAATFEDVNGNEMMMIDVDSDDTFDIIADANGSVLFDETGTAISAGGITVGDAEMNIYGNDAYLASSDTDQTADYGADTLTDDLIS